MNVILLAVALAGCSGCTTKLDNGLTIVQRGENNYPPEHIGMILRAFSYQLVTADLEGWTLEWVDKPIKYQIMRRGRMWVLDVPAITLPKQKLIRVQVMPNTTCAVQSSLGHEFIHVWLYQKNKHDRTNLLDLDNREHTHMAFKAYEESWREKMYDAICKEQK